MSITESNVGQAVRRKKHIEIEDALKTLEIEVNSLGNFINSLTDGPAPTLESEKNKPPEPQFMQVYGNIAERVLTQSSRIAEMTSELQNMLL